MSEGYSFFTLSSFFVRLFEGLYGAAACDVESGCDWAFCLYWKVAVAFDEQEFHFPNENEGEGVEAILHRQTTASIGRHPHEKIEAVFSWGSLLGSKRHARVAECF